MSNTQQPEALNLEEFRAKVTRAAREPLLARIAELEAQLSAIGAGGVEPLRKQAVTAAVAAADERAAFEKWMRIKPCGAAHDFAWEAWKARAALAATQPAAQGMDAQTIRHISALSELVRMPNAEHFADAHNAAVRHLRVIAAQAKQGG